MAKFAFYEDKGGEWRWRLLDDGDEIVAVSGEGFADKGNALDSKNNLCHEVWDDTPIVEDGSDAESGKTTRFAYYKGDDGQYYWRVQNAGNNQIIAVGGEGFASMDEAIAECEKVRALIVAAKDAPLSKFVIYEDKGGEWRWRLLDDSDEIVAVSGECFADKDNALGSKNNLCHEISSKTPVIEDGSDAESGKTTRFAYYKGEDGKYYWRVQNAGNNEIIAIGGEGFASMDEAIAECRKVRALIFAVPAWEFENPDDDEANHAKKEDTTKGKGFSGS